MSVQKFMVDAIQVSVDGNFGFSSRKDMVNAMADVLYDEWSDIALIKVISGTND